ACQPAPAGAGPVTARSTTPPDGTVNRSRTARKPLPAGAWNSQPSSVAARSPGGKGAQSDGPTSVAITPDCRNGTADTGCADAGPATASATPSPVVAGTSARRQLDTDDLPGTATEQAPPSHRDVTGRRTPGWRATTSAPWVGGVEPVNARLTKGVRLAALVMV